MAYVIGLLAKDEEAELVRRGWDIEDPPKELIDKSCQEPDRMKQVWVDTSMFDAMNGPDWEGGTGSTKHSIRPGIYEHYRGGLYRVLFVAWESTNGRDREPVVVYMSMLKGTFNTRRLEEFVERVDRPDGEKWPRFKFVSSGEGP